MKENVLGVALTKCYFCQKDYQIVMNRRLSTSLAEKVESMNGKIVDMTPCQECEDLMKLGVILITIDNARSGKDWYKDKMPNPYRTGGWFVISDEGVERAFDAEMAQWAIDHRWAFIEHQAAAMVGLFEKEGA